MSEETKELLIDLQQYIDEPNNQDINGEYEPPRELEQGEARLLLALIINLQNQLQQKEKIINNFEKWLEEYISLLKDPDIYEEQTLEDLKEVLDKLRELKGDNSNE